ncbi:MAG: hypothetical protein RR851_14665 [Clostridium sp.]
MAKIIAPNKDYTGISASVVFCNGVGETENLELIEWFKNKGYGVEGILNNEEKKSKKK